jgi:nitroimidazol reductase NimA-like FMN-containing flavoprotein (pyridoxamine 5'-phosphate oxidase superfamily)
MRKTNPFTGKNNLMERPMSQPTVSRPKFPPGYVDKPKAKVSWSHVEEELINAKNYWLCSVRPNSRPHVIPKWAVWVEEKIYFDGSPETRHARNIAANQYVSVHLESGDKVVIVEGTARAVGKPDRELATKISQAYGKKYAKEGYAPKPDQWDEGGLFEITPYSAMAWTMFTLDPTKFVWKSD